MSERTEAEKNILNKVEKLLRLAASNPNEEEAANATAKAQALLTAYNLDMAALAENTGDGARLAEELEGGRYQWQKDLWQAVSELNFCMHFNERVFLHDETSTTEEYRRVKNDDGSYVYRKVRGRWTHQHRVIGRKINVLATKAMAPYLEGVCDRIVKERAKAVNERANGRWANSFREGLTNKVILKIYDRRQELLDEEQLKRKEEMQRAAAYNIASTSTATALTISTYVDSEWDANADFEFGEGTSARWAADRAAKAEAERKADEAYTRWAARNPEKAREQEEERRLKEEKDRLRRARKFHEKNNAGAWREGYNAGDGVSLDQQAEQQRPAGYIR